MASMEPERRHSYKGVETQLALLCQTMDRMVLMLEGENNDGFISKTRHDIRNVEQWQEIHEALCKAKSRAIARNMAIWGVVLGALTLLARVIVK